MSAVATSPPVRFLRRLPLPAAFEVLAWGALAFTMAFLAAHGMRQGWRLKYMAPLLPLPIARVILTGIVVRLAWVFVTRQGVRDYLRGLTRPASLLLLLRAWGACLAIWYLYPWLKVALPLLRSRAYDPELWKLDIALHFGVSPSWFLTGLFDGRTTLLVISTWYHVWLYTAMAATGFFIATSDLRQRRRFLFSHVALWVFGAWLYWAVPAMGPCYYRPEIWPDAATTMPRVQATQSLLWRNSRAVLEMRGGASPQVNPFHGVAAMPSLHVGVHVLLALWAFRERRWLGLVFTGGAILTFIGSIVTGWHYAIDGYAGALLAAASYGVACRVERDRAEGAGDCVDEDLELV